MPLDSSVWRQAEIVSSAHEQQAVCACFFGATIEMSVRTTNGAACETAAKTAGRATLGTALGAALGAGRTMWAG